jgi:hypothetical protein
MASIVETLGQELEAIDKEYAKDFAGHSRLTRDIGQLDRILKRLNSVVERIDQIPIAARGPELSRLRDGASQNLDLYRNERKAIQRAQDVGPVFEHFAQEATAANMVFARYMRHFAGKDRTTRDVALLGEIVDELKQIDKRMTQIIESGDNPDFGRDREIVRNNLTQYQKEIELIETAQNIADPDQHASVLAALANEQFNVYQAHFAGEPRISRRPALLMRVLGQLKKYRERMKKIADDGNTFDFNTKNITVVNDRIGIYDAELAEIRKVRQSTPMQDIMAELGGAANRLFDEYRANFSDKPRTQADAAHLGRICDKLGEIRRQMDEMSWAEENEMNAKNLDIVTEQLAMFESEFEAVMRAQQAQSR